MEGTPVGTKALRDPTEHTPDASQGKEDGTETDHHPRGGLRGDEGLETLERRVYRQVRVNVVPV